MATKVKVGSPCILEYIGKRYRGIIKEIRASTKMFKVEFTIGNGKRKQVWRNSMELSPASPHQEDAEPTKVDILPPFIPGVDSGAASDGQAAP